MPDAKSCLHGRKSYPVENRVRQCCSGNIVPDCQQSNAYISNNPSSY